MNTLVQKALSAGITLVGGIVGSRVVAGGCSGCGLAFEKAYIETLKRKPVLQ